MNERTIFCEALEKPTPAERSAFLDHACAGNDALRQRVEALLKSEAEAPEFLAKLAPERVAEELAAPLTSTRTLGEPAACGAEVDLGFLTPSDKPDVLGRLGHYDILEVIGRGGMGVVLRAFDDKLHRMVAIKVMAPQLATSATARKRFTREAQAQAAVSHDHVVTIHAVEEANGPPYLVMQFVDGISLQEQLNRGGPLELAAIVRIGMQTAAGLAAAHAQGLIHRDIKPANILLENGVQRVKLTDFGLARAAADASLTQTGAVAGTPYYMSPEQARGETVDQRSDLFSLGSVLYSACTGRVPFRARDTMAVLRRVCEDEPTPIREVNSEIPDWLAAIVDNLHAKDPVERFQTATEVAELLGRHLMHLQHPSAVPFPDAGKANATPRPDRRKWWAVAAAALVLMVLGLGTTEATGVTRIRSAVIRIFTPDGMLVVEADDPDVKITIEGDGGLLITGAGPQEVRVRPGSYRVQADKAGKSVRLDRDLVTIARGDKQVVRVRLQGDSSNLPVAPNVEPGAFVVLGPKGIGGVKFDTLIGAVQAARNGDTIEVRGNGPFITDPVAIGVGSLIIRAASGFRPVIRLSERGAQTIDPMISITGSLVLEGIELQRLGQRQSVEGQPIRLLVRGRLGSLFLANCRLRSNAPDPLDCVHAECRECVVQNCEFLSPTTAVGFQPSVCKKVVMHNCLHLGRIPVCMHNWTPGKEEVEVRLTHNSLVVPGHQAVHFGVYFSGDRLKQAQGIRLVRIEMTRNLIDTSRVLELYNDHDELDPTRWKALLRRLLSFRSRENLYSVRDTFLFCHHNNEFIYRIDSLADWLSFWGDPPGSNSEGVVRYQGGDLASRLLEAPESISPADFRLHSESAGYRAGKDGKDIGADVDLVGPGAAYERWKKTPDYQHWLKDTGQKP